jgi:hypothetical protein
VSGPEFTLFGKKPMGYIVNMNSGNLEGTWQVWTAIVIVIFLYFFMDENSAASN